MMFFLRIFALGVCLFLSATLFNPFPTADAQEGGSPAPLRFSLIPKKDIDQQITDLRPLLDLLGRRLQRPIRVIRPQSYQSVIEGLLSHNIDFAILGPASYAYARARDKKVDAFASFSRKAGIFTPKGSYYYSLLFAIKNRKVHVMNDLKDKKVALTDPASTSGSLVPRVEFSKQTGLSVEDFFSTRIFTGSHDRSIKSVIDGHVDAAFVSSARLDEAVKKGELRADQVLILWQSQPIHRDPFVFGGALDDPMRKKIRGIMLSAPPELNEMFARMQMEGIVAVSDEDYKQIHELAAMKNKANK